MEKSFEAFAKHIGINLNDVSLLQQALTHRSYINEHKGYHLDHNERLEFLGDAVLELVVTRYLYDHYDNPEGELTSWRAALVCGDMLASVAKELNIEDYLLMSRGEAKDTGRARQYLLANSVEAIIGAIYLDQGYEAAREFILKYIVVHIDEVLEQKLYLDPKSHFQEMAQDKVGLTPMYKELGEAGPDHDKHFEIGVYLGEQLIAQGAGKSKQEAQRNAAKKALDAKGWL